jgi:hypothetical protein
MANTPAARIASAPAVQSSTSSVHLTLHRLENVVDLIEARLKRLEHSHSSLRRRVAKRTVVQ